MSFISKIYTTINNHILFNVEVERPSIEKQKEYLYSFDEPQNMIERSYYKYKCLLFHSYSKKQRVIINLISFFAIFPLGFFYRLKGIKYDSKLFNYQPDDVLLKKATMRIPITDIFPNDLNVLCSKTIEYNGVSYSKLFISKDAFTVFWKVLRAYPFNFHYCMVILIRLSQACYLMEKYSPKCITTYVCEREFADPILTEYYEAHQVEYHGHMHGDYLLSIEQAFMHYSKYWIWEEHYKKLFLFLRCSFITQIYKPLKYSGIVKPRKRTEDYDFYATYYFSDETKEAIEIIGSALLKLKKNGHKCKVRPHPRFSHVDMINDLFGKDFLVEDTSKITIEESMECSYLTIAPASTVLSQAYYSGKKIVIDDISNPRTFNQLREKRYILIDKADMLFSELIAKE